MKNILSTIKNNDSIYDLWNLHSCQVAVHYIVYDKRRDRIVDFGSSRVCGVNHYKKTIHAEELAIKYCIAKTNNKKSLNRYKIIIFRFDKQQHIRPVNSCKKCTKLAEKYDLKHKLFTIEESNLKSCIVKNPVLSIGDQKRVVESCII